MLNNIERMKYALTEWAIKEGVFDDATFYTLTCSPLISTPRC